jgi:diguanylate cyclase (GGDEF)-like protein
MNAFGVLGRLTFRLAFLSTGLALLVAAVGLSLGGSPIARHWELHRQHEALEALADVVQPTASAACFAEDPGLAGEVARGLIGTANVQAATILAGDKILGQARRAGPSGPPGGGGIVARALSSPFAADSIVGRIVLVPDPGEAERRGAETAAQFRVWILVALGILGAGNVIVVHGWLVRPLSGLAGRLRSLGPGSVQTLQAPRSHRKDEIGGLVEAVNGLVGRLQEALWASQTASGPLPRRSPGPAAPASVLLVRADGGLEVWSPGLPDLLGRQGEPWQHGTPLAALFGGQEDQVAACLDAARGGAAQVMLRMPDGTWLHLALEAVGGGWFQGWLEEAGPGLDGAGGALERDPLTGALNRFGAERALLARLRNGRSGPGIVLLHLGGLAQILQDQGRAAADAVLKEAHRRLDASLRPGAALARLGGEAFLVILDLPEDPAEGLRIAEELRRVLGAPFALPGGREARIRASAGLAQDPTGDPQARLERAEQALGEALRAGGDRCVVKAPAGAP